MEYFHLTVQQKNIWNLQKYYENAAISNICGAIFYKEKRNSELLKKAIYQLIDNQSALRLRFCEDDGPKQYVSVNNAEDISVMKFTSVEELDSYAEKFAKEPIGLINCNMYRFVVFEVQNKSGVLVLLSHLVADAWTFGVLAQQTDELYYKLERGKDCEYMGGDYIDYIRLEDNYVISNHYSKDKIYWEKKYSIKPQKSLIKSIHKTTNSIMGKRITRRISVSLEQKIAEYCKIYSVTPAVVFETALMIYLSKINVQNQSVTIGIPVLNRSKREKNIAGMFISTMPLTIINPQKITVLELQQQITDEHMNIFRHQRYPYSDILKFLREKHDFTGNLYNVMFSYQNAKTNSEGETKWYSNGCSEVPFIVHIDNRDGNNSHTINVEYQTEVFKDEMEIEYIIARLEYIIKQMIEDNTKKVKDIGVTPQKEAEQLIDKFNDNFMEYQRDKCVHELFSEQVAVSPDKVALVFEDKEFTYRQLDEMSDILAHFLSEKGIGKKCIVPIIAIRSWQLIVAMLGVLKAGGAYMPITTDYPVERIQYIINTANSNFGFVLGYEEQLEGIELFDVDKLIKNNTNYEEVKIESGFRMNNTVTPEDACYIIFTSGSTGVPKGIILPHKTITNLVSWQQLSGVLDDSKRILSFTTIIFDVFTQEVFSALLSGRTLLLISDEVKNNIHELKKYIRDMRADILYCTPSYYSAMTREEGVEINKVILAGEAFYINENMKNQSITYYNQYGPAETHVVSCAQIKEFDNITIGKPIANTQIYILDKDNILLPIGVEGELCIAGEGVANGYLNRLELTEDKFVKNPFATLRNHHGKVIYHTGDLARWRVDGNIEYLGRIDTQVKIRGLRIELGEIESVMSSIDGVMFAAVSDRCDANDKKYLVGYYTSVFEIEDKIFRELLSKKLPKYMIPNYFIRLDHMPMTSSGKIDRKQLLIHQFESVTAKYAAPITEIQKRLCNILEEILHKERIGINDDFFEIGGDSLAAIEYVAKAHSIGIDFKLQNVFDYPTIYLMCKFMGQEDINEKINDINGNYYKHCDFDRYENIFKTNVINNAFVPRKKSLGNVLLTGATGFLGAHILDQFMKEETGKLYCLVRNCAENDRKEIENIKTEKVGNVKLKNILRYYFGNKYDDAVGDRILPIAGDIEDVKLSEYCPVDVDMVIHTAATVKHYGSYEYFKRINVKGTENVVNYAKKVNAKMIHISTIGVSGNSLTDYFREYNWQKDKIFDETSFFINQPLDNVYIRSKFEAERVVYDAMLEGLGAKIIRVGNLTNRVADMKFQSNYKENAFLTRMKAFIEFGLFPDYMLYMSAEFSPVDQTAEGIIKIAQYTNKYCIFHLNNRPVYYEYLIEILKKAGIDIKVIKGNEFNDALQKTVNNKSTEYIYKSFQNEIDSDGKLVYDSNVIIKKDFTNWFMNKIGFEWYQIDWDYIRRYIEYFREQGYFQ